MPQINRIRVNNVKYNFGTQFYDDFMMRFNCSNTIYDLANGGGKSLLMLLLMQNVIPNCTLDEKQPIEKLFRQGGGNTVIHSLVEWKLDPCYQKDNYKYMTTGFCARRKKNGEDEGSDQIDAVSTVSQSRDNSSVEYFNYCIFYREFGDNDIKNLPLTSNGERITYNGLKAYLRELEKNDFNVSVKIFEKKGDYQSFITQYGIFESQWEIIRGINKTEGHVRTYFETNYRTSRKVVEDLLIEEIIQKSFNNRLGVENDEGKMAQTLLDIKDKLLELSKKHAKINGYDSQIAAIENFAGYVLSFKDLFDRKQALEKQLYDYLIACKYRMVQQEKSQSSVEALLERMLDELSNEQKNIQTAEIMAEQISLKSLEELVELSKSKLSSKDKEMLELSDKLKIMESVNDYADYLSYKKNLDELEVAISNRMRDHQDIIDELKEIAMLFKKSNDQEKRTLEDQCNIYKQQADKCRAEREEIVLKQQEAIKQQAAKRSVAEFAQVSIDNHEKTVAKLLEMTELLVPENAGVKALELKEEIAADETFVAAKEEEYQELIDKYTNAKGKLAALAIHNEILRKQIEKAESFEDSADDSESRFENIARVYDCQDRGNLKNVIFDLYNRMEKEYIKLEEEIFKLQDFMDNAKMRKYICKDPLRDQLKEYLETHYENDVVEGHEWFNSLNAGQKRDVFKRAPFVEYSFVIKGDFERIKQDTNLLNFNRGAYAIPVISEQVLSDTKLEVNKDLIAFAFKDMNFLRDEAKLEAELALAKEETDNLRHRLERLWDRKNVVWEDYNFIVANENSRGNDGLYDVAQLREQLASNLSQWDGLESGVKSMKAETDKLKEQIRSREIRLAAKRDCLEKLYRIVDITNDIENLYNQIRQAKDDVAQSELVINVYKAKLKDADYAVESAESMLASAKEKLKKAEENWNNNYSRYYDESVTDVRFTDNTNISKEQLENRFFGLKEILEKETVDVADKEALISHCRISMEKCRKSIEYRGSDFEYIKACVENGTFRACEASKLYRVKEQLKTIERETKQDREELDAQNALMNRLEGSVAHGINQIEEKYGEFKEFECDNPEKFITQHKELIKKLSDNIRETKEKINKKSKALKDIYVIEKDLERIINNAGLSIPVINSESEPEQEIKALMEQLKGYEAVSKEYDTHMKLAYRKKDEFNKHRQSLTDLLTGFDAAELATQIRTSVNAPETPEETVELANRLKETNSFIQLEKDRVAKGIQDMERIKDNFENRCVQTCSNIKAELDRLPKLSNITLEDENISIIGLQIPYVKEEMYKERMSAYIDETITMAESFKDSDERLKYIRNRLTWKKLFSVIVTDMNSIRINLYKRERIKDQSRYLKYEEAVGSTGQSQGIYIQFLIAIINYISSINASANETNILGKTIFIDNPFGAAKDIYIWEPIFKLLKTNHVQLIVPARGATPAITGRFDVNYILGQKLVDKMQQTVVVDYFSRVNNSQMEYTRMDYEQAVFTFE